MIGIEVVCTGKNTRMEAGAIITDITFQPANSTISTHSVGAVIGIPDPNGLPTAEKLCYTLISGTVTVSVTDSKEADKYQVGQTFQLSVLNIK